MKLTPRPYQQEAHDAVIAWWKLSKESCVVAAATGSGKSLIISMIAKTLFDLSGGKRILCLAPSSELVKQNAEKYESFGNECSIYSASISKSLRHQVVFASEGTFKKIAKKMGAEFAGVIIDECHRTTATVKQIISDMRETSPNLRVCGLSASPYRLNDGYVYQYGMDKTPIPHEQTRNPFYHSLVYEITAPELIEMGFLTRPHADTNHAASYDMEGVNYSDKKESDKAVEGKGRLTAGIVADIVNHSYNRKGVMIFAATVKHAQEIMESLPSDNSRMIGGDINMAKAERNAIVGDFKAMRYKYLVNVATMTTGVDFTHVDLIAILRATQSASLFQQIIGRALRLHTGKNEALILDYGQNIEHFKLEDDLFSPEIQARHNKKGEPMQVVCPMCDITNNFSARPNPEESAIDSEGYFCDLEGNRIEFEGQEFPAHFGRSCQGYEMVSGNAERCAHKWAFKECLECNHENDIAARFCKLCKVEIIDPNDKLVLDYHRMKADKYAVSTDTVKSLLVQKHMSKANNETLKATFTTEYATFDLWFQPESTVPKFRAKYDQFSLAFYGKVAPSVDVFLEHLDKGRTPQTITYHRIKGKKFYEVFAYNQPIDVEPVIEELSSESKA